MNHKFKKKFGQNFLQDQHILESIVSSVPITAEDLVIEIGPGSGNLTKEILKYTKKVICYEIDTDLEKHLSKYKNIGAKIIYDDFLKRDIKLDLKNELYKKLYIISNLPYYITTPIIEKIIDLNLDIASCVFMVQKEVADRFLAHPNSRNYNSLTIFLNYYFEMEKIIDVPRKFFYPVPNVDSSVIKLQKTFIKYHLKDEQTFFKLIKDSFKYKRKTIKNNLSNYNLNKIENVLKQHDLNLSSRAEEISIETFVEISNNI